MPDDKGVVPVAGTSDRLGMDTVKEPVLGDVKEPTVCFVREQTGGDSVAKGELCLARDDRGWRIVFVSEYPGWTGYVEETKARSEKRKQLALEAAERGR